jgi:OHCU decarboxylase
VALDVPPRGQILYRARGLATINTASTEAAEAAFKRCCGSSRWSLAMTARRPYAGVTALAAAADRVWQECGREDWLEAFAAHPRIGQPPANRWAQQEQAGAAGAEARVLQSIADLNQRYAEKFGYIYIVCATGRTAAEMLAILERRIQNEPDAELLEAAEQQRQITRLRLEKLLTE